jgi:hypothetical protein
MSYISAIKHKTQQHHMDSDSHVEMADHGANGDLPASLAPLIESDDVCVFMTGVPFSARDADVQTFFGEQLRLAHVALLLDAITLKPTGECCCQFGSKQERDRALDRDDQLFRNRVVKVRTISFDEYKGYIKTHVENKQRFAAKRSQGALKTNTYTSNNNSIGSNYATSNTYYDKDESTSAPGDYNTNRYNNNNNNYNNGNKMGFARNNTNAANNRNNRNDDYQPRHNANNGSYNNNNNNNNNNSGFKRKPDFASGQTFHHPNNNNNSNGHHHNNINNNNGITKKFKPQNEYRTFPSNRGFAASNAHDANEPTLTDLPPLPAELQKYRNSLLLMSNVAQRASREEILDFIKVFAPIEQTLKIRHDDTGKPTGDVIVACQSPADANKACRSLNGADFMGQSVKTSLVNP